MNNLIENINLFNERKTFIRLFIFTNLFAALDFARRELQLSDENEYKTEFSCILIYLLFAFCVSRFLFRIKEKVEIKFNLLFI